MLLLESVDATKLMKKRQKQHFAKPFFFAIRKNIRNFAREFYNMFHQCGRIWLLATTLKNAKTAKSPSDFTVTWRYSTLKK
jgi:hypothetical protein